MLQFTPKSVTLTENDLKTVASYDVEVHLSIPANTVLTTSKNADPSGVTVIPLGIGSSPIFTDAMVVPGQQATVKVREVGPSGELTPFVQVGGTVNVLELPDGFENATLQV